MKRPTPLDAEFDTATARLTVRELGVLIRLVRYFWTCGELPASVEGRAKVAGVTPAVMESVAPALAPFFKPGGWAPIARQVAVVRTAKRAAAGRASARSRWGAGSVQPAA